jgi:hypothetical protein
MNRIRRVGLILLLVASALAQQKAEQAEPVRPTTWQAPETEIHGKLTAARTRALPDSVFAFPRVRKEPLTDAAHVRSAIARFAQVKGVTDEERDLACANIRKAAAFFGVRLRETDWRQWASGRHPQ